MIQKIKGLLVLTATLLLSAMVWIIGPTIAVSGHYYLNGILPRVLLIIGMLMISVIYLFVTFTKQSDGQKTEKTEAADQNKKKYLLLQGKEQDASAINQSFLRAHHFMKHHKKSGLPTFLLLGNPGSGRTSFVNHCGVQIIPDASFAEKISEGLTFMFSDKATFIKIDYSILQASVDFTQICSALTTHLKRYSLDGVVICRTVAEILHEQPDLILEYSMLLDQMTTHLSRELPIYYVVTQLEAITGSQRFFEKLTTTQQQEILGITFSKTDTPFSAQFQEDGERLAQYINSQIVDQLQHSNNPKLNTDLFLFPSRFLHFQNKVVPFIKGVFEGNPYRTTHLLRGIYFANFEGRTQNAFPCETPYARFIYHLFHDLMLKEQGFVELSKPRSRRVAAWHLALYGMIASIILGVSGIWLYSFQLNHHLVTTTRELIQAYQETRELSGTNKEVLPTLTALSEISRSFEQDHRRLGMHWGLYVGDQLKSNLDRAYAKIAQLIMDPILKGVFLKRLHQEAGLKLYHTLMIYLMLGDPPKKEPNRIDAWLAVNPIHRYKAQSDQQLTWNELVKYYLRAQHQPFATDNTLVNSARKKLRSLTTAQRAYFVLEEKSAKQSPLTLINPVILNGNVFQYASKKIPFLYTQSGWEKLYKKISVGAVQTAIEENWVLGASKEMVVTDPIVLKKQLDQLYINGYINTWRNHLARLSIVRFKNVQDATRILGILAEEQSPLQQVLETTRKETNFNEDESTLTPIRQSFSPLNQLMKQSDKKQPTPYQVIQKGLINISMFLNTISNASDPSAVAYQVSKSNFAGTGACLDQLSQIAANTPEPVRSWLKSIVKQTRQVILRAGQQWFELHLEGYDRE